MIHLLLIGAAIWGPDEPSAGTLHIHTTTTLEVEDTVQVLESKACKI
jgi:hypothetical protein